MTDNFNFSKQKLLAHKIKPIKQFDKYACWAACLSWWAKARPIGIRRSGQLEILADYSRYTVQSGPKFGGINISNMKRILDKPKWKAKTQLVPKNKITHAFLREKLKMGPIFVAFYRGSTRGFHANILIAPSVDRGGREKGFIVMEPDKGKMILRTYGSYSSYTNILIAFPKK